MASGFTYSPVNLRGDASSKIASEILFLNKTISDNLVNFETEIKYSRIFSENIIGVTIQAYTCGNPTADGGITIFDTEIFPAKYHTYDTFCMNDLRASRFKTTMKPGAWETTSSEFESAVLSKYAPKISQELEKLFWSGVTSATKTAVAALTPGTGQGSIGADEQNLIASLSAGFIDGIVTKMIYNNSNAAGTNAVGGRIKVDGSAATTASNVNTVFAAAYAAIPAEVLANPDGMAPFFYAPHNVKQMIYTFNTNATYRDTFLMRGEGPDAKFYYNGLEIVFVPMPADTLIVALPEHFSWLTDLLSDYSMIKMDLVANNQETMFLKTIGTIAAHVANQRYNVLYCYHA